MPRRRREQSEQYVLPCGDLLGDDRVRVLVRPCGSRGRCAAMYVGEQVARIAGVALVDVDGDELEAHRRAPRSSRAGGASCSCPCRRRPRTMMRSPSAIISKSVDRARHGAGELAFRACRAVRTRIMRRQPRRRSMSLRNVSTPWPVPPLG